MDFTQIFESLIGLLAVIITSFVIPLLKAKLDTAKYNKTIDYVSVAVKAAEQLFGSGTGKEKLTYVKKYLKDKGITFDDTTIESVVNKYFGAESEFLALLDPAETEKMETEFIDEGVG